jgi:hypothetical protein
LAASDVKKPIITTIEEVDMMDFAREGERKKVKAVLTLKGVSKLAVVNKTNADSLSEAFGKDFDDWEGKRIEVKAEETTFQGKRTKGLRFYPANASKPAKKESENPADFDDSPDL